MKIYLASSWRNERYPAFLEGLREAGHEVYDFRNGGFAWSDEGLDGAEVDLEQLVDVLTSDRVQKQFCRDTEALYDCDVLVCLLPCGRSAHLEAGLAIGLEKPAILVWHPGEPDIMHMLFDGIVLDLESLLEELHDMEHALEIGTLTD